jgi:uncharacterized membrane protein HdeD (DUF308 family)
MRTGLVFLLRALAALTIACMAILAAVTAIGLVLIAVGALALADDYSLLRVAGMWVLATAGLLSVSRLAYLGACALGAGGDRDGSPANRR